MAISVALEARRAAFLEREQAFLEIRGPRRELERERLALHRRGQPGLERVMDALFSEPERDGRARGELGDERGDRSVELVVGDGAVDDPPRRGLDAGNLPTEQQQLLRPRDADQAREQPR